MIHYISVIKDYGSQVSISFIKSVERSVKYIFGEHQIERIQAIAQATLSRLKEVLGAIKYRRDVLSFKTIVVIGIFSSLTLCVLSFFSNRKPNHSLLIVPKDQSPDNLQRSSTTFYSIK
jgi:hypothetical protein